METPFAKECRTHKKLNTLGKYFDRDMEGEEITNSITARRKKLLRHFVKFEPTTISMVSRCSQNNYLELVMYSHVAVETTFHREIFCTIPILSIFSKRILHNMGIQVSFPNEYFVGNSHLK